MPPILHTVVETPEFSARARRILSEGQRNALIDFVAAHPTAGDVMQGSGGARKLRVGLEGQGKERRRSSDHFFGGREIPVFLLAIFAKSEKANLSKAERNELRSVLRSLASEYRKGAR